MTEAVATNRIRHQYLAYIDENAIPADLNRWIHTLRYIVPIETFRDGLELMDRQLTIDNTTIHRVHSSLTGSTVEHESGQEVAQAHQVASDEFRAPNRQDAGNDQIQRIPAFSNLRDLDQGDESTPSEDDNSLSTVGYHVSRGSGGTNPNGDT